MLTFTRVFRVKNPWSYSPADLLGVLVQAFPQLGGVGPHAVAGIVPILIHQQLELPHVRGAALLGFRHVLLESVEQKLHVLRQLPGGALSVGHQLVLDVFSVLGQLGYGVGDQGAET